VNLTSFNVCLLNVAEIFCTKRLLTLPNQQPKYYFPNEPSEVSRNSHDTIGENKLFGNLLHFNNVYLSILEGFVFVWLSTVLRDMARHKWVIF